MRDPRNPLPERFSDEGIFTPERSASEWGIAVLLFGFSILFLWPFRSFMLFNSDEGIVLDGAQRILRGDILYRDFFSFYTPFSFYWLALIFKIFGNSLLVARTLLLTYGGLYSLIVYFLARRIVTRWIAILAAYLLLVIAIPYRPQLLHNWESTLWALLALYFAVRWVEEPHAGWAFATGTFTMLTALCEQSKGAGLVAGFLLAFLLIIRGGGARTIFTRARVWALMGGLVWPLLITIGYFGVEHSLPQMLAGWFWPLFHYSTANRLPYGFVIINSHHWETLCSSASWSDWLFIVVLLMPGFIIPALPAAGLGILGYHAARVWRMRRCGERTTHLILVCSVCTGLILSTVATGRPDFTHILFIAPPFFVILAWALDGRIFRSAFLSQVRPLLAVYLLILFTINGLGMLWSPRNARITEATRRGVVKMEYPDTVLPFVREHVAAGSPLFVYPYQPLVYYLTDTVNPTRYEFLQPGMNPWAEFQEALDELAAARSPVVLFDPTFFGERVPWHWPATPPAVAAKDPGRDFIFDRYRPCRTLSSPGWSFVYMVRRDMSCPH